MTSTHQGKSNNHHTTKIKEYHDQIQMVDEKKHILKCKEERVTKLKDDIHTLSMEAEQLNRKLQTTDFLLESSAEEQSQIKTALSKDRYNKTLRSKLQNVNLDLRQQFDQEIKQDEKLISVYEEMIKCKAMINEQHKYMGHLKDDIHEGSIQANMTRKHLYGD